MNLHNVWPRVRQKQKKNACDAWLMHVKNSKNSTAMIMWLSTVKVTCKKRSIYCVLLCWPSMLVPTPATLIFEDIKEDMPMFEEERFEQCLTKERNLGMEL